MVRSWVGRIKWANSYSALSTRYYYYYYYYCIILIINAIPLKQS